MAQQIINLGTPPGGTDGDTSRVAFEKTSDNFDELYTRAQGKLTKDVSGAGTLALSPAEAINGIIDMTGALTGNRIVTVPPSPTQVWAIRNSTTGAFTLAFQTSSGSGIQLAAGRSTVVFSDGTNIVDLSAMPAPSTGRLLGVRVITTSGTYTPTPGCTYAIVEIQGAGGAGAGAPATGAGQCSAAGAGGAGGYIRLYVQSPTATAVVIGAGGVGVSGGDGGNGGATSFGSVTAGGGSGGNPSVASADVVSAIGGAGGTATGGNLLNMPGTSAPVSLSSYTLNILMSFPGANSPLGTGGRQGRAGAASPGTGYGSGGGGVVLVANQGPTTGANGAPGVVIVTEYS
ncbi:hypothetical protein [Pandoraea sp. CB10b_02]|uniref:glycine-rich domain-containing protein n=1 Tax=Pandoraea sp. CB10b_02 TaxID=2014535 RepID=UPI00257B1D6D|nr:hypothetical protein [Pandoraea sp. CB10b_02]